jgi:Domain of unknown function (DUF1996)
VIGAGVIQAGSVPSYLHGYFISSCRFSHRAPDDPIVFPRRPGWSHDHTFVGNVSTNAFSTLSSLLPAGTTCNRKADTAAYWAPTLFVNGSPVVPLDATIYYRRLTAARVRPYPPGLKMIAGDSHARSPQSLRVTSWECLVLKTTQYTSYAPEAHRNALRRLTASISAAPSSIPHCSRRSSLRLHVNFPDCWNGKSLDSPNHKSHMAYSIRGKCPSTHPVAVPAISLVYRYPAIGRGTVVLSSGGTNSGHADYVNAWKQSALAKLVNNCLNALRACGLGS